MGSVSNLEALVDWNGYGGGRLRGYVGDCVLLCEYEEVEGDVPVGFKLMTGLESSL